MKILPVNFNNNFNGTPKNINTSDNKKKTFITKKDVAMFGVGCLVYLYGGIKWAAPNFKNLNINDKIGRVLGGAVTTIIPAALFAGIMKLADYLTNKEK